MGSWWHDVHEVGRASFRGVVSVLRTQILLFLINFFLLCVGLALIGIPWWGLIAFGISVVDIIPVVGSGVVMIPWAVIRLAMGATREGILLLVVYAVIFLARQILDPVLNGRAIGVRPFYTLLSTLLFTLLLGPWGLLVGTVFAVVVKTVLEVRSRRREEAALREAPEQEDDSPRIQ